jgi:hypothetical protein
MSEMSATSSITDFDLRPAASERRFDQAHHDPMMDAIRQKLSTVLFKDGRQVDADISDEVVEALASLVLSAPKKNHRTLSTTLENQPLEDAKGSSHSRKGRGKEHRGATSPKRSRAGATTATTTRSKKSSSNGSCTSNNTSATHHKQKRRSSLSRRFEKDADASESSLDVSSTISPTDARTPYQSRRGSVTGSTRYNHQQDRETAPTTTRKPRRSSVTTTSSAQAQSTVEAAPSRKRSVGRRNSAFGSSVSGDHSIPTDRELNARGWKKAMDVGSGRYYFYSMDHSQVVWENPLTLSATRRAAPSWNQVGSIWTDLVEEQGEDEDDPFGVDPFAARF